MTETAGVDFSATKPDPTQLERGGFRFVLGYLKPLLGPGRPNPKELTAAQIAGYRAAGLQVGVFWETTADRALSGAAGGSADGAAAVDRARAIGYPAGCVIIAAVDFDATAAQMPTVLAYLLEFDDAVRAGGHPGGAYGSFDVVEAAHAARPALYLCQTAAWSHGRLSAHAHLYQRATPSGRWPVIPGCDEEVLCQPLPLYGAAPAPTDHLQEDDMPPCLAFRNSPALKDPATGKAGDGEIALAAPNFWFHVPSPGYMALLQAHGWCGAPVDVSPNQFAFHRQLALSNRPAVTVDQTAAGGLTGADVRSALVDVLTHGTAAATT